MAAIDLTQPQSMGDEDPELTTETEEVEYEDLEPNWMTAVRACQEKQATDLRVLDLREVTSFTDYFIVCSGSNSKQNTAIGDEVLRMMKKRGELPISAEGFQSSEWILIDFADFIVHIFSPKAREYYDLERLWKTAKTVQVPAE